MPPRIPAASRGLLNPLTAPHLFASTPAAAIASPASLLLLRTYASQKHQSKDKDKPRKKKTSQWFKTADLRLADQYSLTEAMRYLRAFEVGYPTSKYDLAVRLRTQKSGPTVKNRIRLPHAVKTDMRICVIADGKAAQRARDAGASVVGYEDVIKQIQEGNLNFDRVICQDTCYPVLTKAGVGRILGPKGMMPSPKTGTVVKDPAAAIKELTGKNDYRERLGVVRVAIGQIGFTEEQLATNIKAFMTALKKDLHALSYQADKGISEVVLSSTFGPGFSLTGDLRPMAEKKDEGEVSVGAEMLGAEEKAEQVEATATP